ncbi:MAG: GNAT family N-acetyltransferase [Phycisphaerales bacterium]|nr:MAG: GNAT family N-acetyltransferase [Phycisphaerales bacterium]
MGKKLNVDIGLPADDSEVQAFTRIVSQALFFPAVDLDVWIKREGPENIRVARRKDGVVGGLIVQRMGQWFGGRSVPMGAVRAVGVAPEHRATGVASQLLTTALEEMRRDGVPLSALFPATQPVYRRPGYEQAGVRLTYRLPASAIDVRDRTLHLRPIEPADRDAVRRAYSERARRTSGNLDRNEWYWQRIFDPPPWGSQTYGYQIEHEGRAEAYTVFAQKAGDKLHNAHHVELVDLVTLTAEAGRRLLTFFADHRSMAKTVTWSGAPAEPMLYLLAEQASNIVHRLDWMLRIVDVRCALEARGYPPAANTDVHVEVVDDVLRHNHGRFVLEVSDSQGRVREGGGGNVRIDVRGLAALYTGHLSPADLKLAGYLDGPDEDLAKAALVFAGPAPWMPDIF